MIVEKPPAAKESKNDLGAGVTLGPGASKPASQDPPSSTKTAAAEPRVVYLSPGTQTVECLCGDRLFVRAQAPGTVMSCTSCERKIRVETKEASSARGLPAVSLPPGSRNPTPPPSSYAKPEASCECGQPLELVKALASQGTVCSGCGRTITMEKIRGPQSKSTVIRPKFGPAIAPGSPAPTKSEPAGVFEMPNAEFVPDEPLPPRANLASYQEVFCPCGEALTVGNEDVGRNIQCPTCLTLMAVDQLRDPKTGNSVVRVRGIGKMEQDTWSLSDFS